jgi:hypothetical protein
MLRVQLLVLVCARKYQDLGAQCTDANPPGENLSVRREF